MKDLLTDGEIRYVRIKLLDNNNNKIFILTAYVASADK